MDKVYDVCLKIVLVGDSGCGKSSILRRYSDGVFTNDFISTIGVDFDIKAVRVSEKDIRLQLWDTAGQDRFESITASYYRGAANMILVYDPTDKNSLDRLELWFQRIERFAPEGVSILLVQNKSDLRSKFTEAQINKMVEHYQDIHPGLIHVKCSAKTGLGVNDAFMKSAELGYNNFLLNQEGQQTVTNDKKKFEYESELDGYDTKCCMIL